MKAHILGDKRTWNKIELDSELIERLNREAEQEKPSTKKKPQPEPPTTITPSSTDSSLFWTFNGVNYRNEIYNVDLSKTLLDNGTAKTQQSWAEYSEEAMKRNDFYTADMPLYHSLFTTLSKLQTQEAQEAREFIKKQMREKWLTTLTRIAYQPVGKDKIIHNYGTGNKYELEENIVEKTRIIEAADSSALKALLGTDNINEINSVYQILNSTPTFIWRLNSKPDSIDERVAGFYAGSDRVSLSCNRNSAVAYPSLGVRSCREAAR